MSIAGTSATEKEGFCHAGNAFGVRNTGDRRILGQLGRRGRNGWLGGGIWTPKPLKLKKARIHNQWRNRRFVFLVPCGGTVVW
jgi:hypothetical protein